MQPNHRSLKTIGSLLKKIPENLPAACLLSVWISRYNHLRRSFQTEYNIYTKKQNPARKEHDVA